MMEVIEAKDDRAVVARVIARPAEYSIREGATTTMKKERFTLWHARMILGGAIAGVALASIILTALGVQPRESHDLIGAAVGSGASAILLKLAHLI
jgi:hypothetical protein